LQIAAYLDSLPPLAGHDLKEDLTIGLEVVREDHQGVLKLFEGLHGYKRHLIDALEDTLEPMGESLGALTP
jgi:hypothetical protein